jgi:hypothetical protein
MSTLKKLLVAAAAMSVLVIVRTEAADKVADPATAEPVESGSRFISGISTSHSFADIVNLPGGAEHLLTAVDTEGRGRAGTFAELSDGADTMPKRLARANSATSLLGEVTAMNGAFGDMSATVVAADLFPSRPGAAGAHTNAQFLFAAAEVPEPTEWMTLLCGVVVVAFMVRRKRGPFAD